MEQGLNNLIKILSRHSSIGHWNKALTSPDLMHAIVRNSSDFAGAVKARLALRDIDLEAAFAKGYVSISHDDGNKTVFLFLQLGLQYALVKEYFRAKNRGRVDITPHGWFWSLPVGNVQAAAKYWRNFGVFDEFPLRMDHGDEYVHVDLGEFWGKLRRFRAVTKLWISLEDTGSLRQSWVELRRELKTINEADSFPFGSLPIGEAGAPIEIDSTLLSCMEDLEEQSFAGWLAGIDASTLRAETISLIECELNAHLRVLPTWRAMKSSDRPSFELNLFPRTLWSAIWYFFALDTQVGIGWRICPHHQRLFYPLRRDRFYCKTDEQTLYSKLAWWKKHKTDELAKRREKRRKTRRTKEFMKRGEE